jgi:hypothetical protein
MKRQRLASPLLGRNEGADTCKSPKNSILLLAGAAILLFGCQEDPVGKAPGGLEPSASSQQSGEHDDSGVGDPGDGAQSAGSGEDSDGSGSDGSGSDGDDSGDSGSGSGSGGAN